jgi:hypothetical protein
MLDPGAGKRTRTLLLFIVYTENDSYGKYDTG